MTLDDAIAVVNSHLATFDVQSEADKIKMLDSINTLKETLKVAQRREHDIKELRAKSTREKALERKAYRDAVIPGWIKDNIKPGMVVKVKGSASTPLRAVISIGIDTLTGRHCKYQRYRDENNDWVTNVVGCGYITDHILENITGVVTSIDARTGRPVTTTIMDLVEGKKKLS